MVGSVAGRLAAIVVSLLKSRPYSCKRSSVEVLFTAEDAAVNGLGGWYGCGVTFRIWRGCQIFDAFSRVRQFECSPEVTHVSHVS